jgi:hypothetical protein
VIAADIVIDAGFEVQQCRQDGVAFGGVQIAAAGVAAKGPTIAVELLPSGQSEGQLKESGDARQVNGWASTADGLRKSA